MSQMKELYEKVSKDGALKGKFNQIMQDAEQAGEAKTGEKLLAFAREVGHQVDLDEMKTFFKAMAENKTGELSDLELDMVAGGKSNNGVIAIGTSVLSLGIACAAFSYAYALNDKNCGDIFQ